MSTHEFISVVVGCDNRIKLDGMIFVTEQPLNVLGMDGVQEALGVHVFDKQIDAVIRGQSFLDSGNFTIRPVHSLVIRIQYENTTCGRSIVEQKQATNTQKHD